MINAQEKTPLAELVDKAIELSADSTFAEFYFNPLFGKDLPNLVPGLQKAGFFINTLEIEKDDGLHISSKLIYNKDKSSLNLGEIILTGTSIEVVKLNPLQPVLKVVEFIRKKSQGG